MLPTSASGLLSVPLTVTRQPGKTYRMDTDRQTVSGFCDGREAVRQAIHKILLTERYQYIMYSWNYGVELLDLYGQPVSYVCPELERRITEALMQDDRITSVDGFTFDTTQRGAVHVTFTAHTIYGDIEAEKEVAV